jgi:hypothetical protein
MDSDQPVQNPQPNLDKLHSGFNETIIELIKSQVELDPECNRILHDNLWDLYER